MLNKIRIYLEMIKFEHTVFALPFALAAAFVASNGIPEYIIILWIVLAVVGARTSAMTFNRIADHKYDALNPRTQNRAIPQGAISIQSAWFFLLLSSAIFFYSAYKLNNLTLYLSPLAFAAIIFYSYLKRFTCLSHLWLGMCLSIAPMGAWIAVTGKFDIIPIFLCGAVLFWTAGFDIIYSLQDVEFDKENNLKSLASKHGCEKALFVSRFFHGAAIILLILFGLFAGLRTIYQIGVIFAGAALIFEHTLVLCDDLSKVNTAFFTVNGFISIGVMLFIIADVLL
ncbi:MAG: 4-hydroxybenzoate octaprenyltransferase [Armatimonadota bacterium]